MKKDKAARAMEHIDDELILSSMDSSDKNGKKRASKNILFKRLGAIAAAFVVLLGVGVFAGQLVVNAENATIAIDVNPSMEIEINGREKVVEINVLNEDAEIVIGDMELEGLDLEVAMNAIIGSMLKHGYLSTDQNSILISIDSGNEKKAESLKEKLSSEIGALLGESNIDASVMTQDYDKDCERDDRAEKNKLSRGKAALISRIVEYGLLDANGVPYTYDALAKLKINELKLILESKGVSVEGVDRSGTAGDGGYISKDEALRIALMSAGYTNDEILRLELEMDYDDDISAMVYEIEFCAGDRRYEYEINAKSGDIADSEIKTREEHKHDENDERVDAPEEAITRETALETVYADAGVKAEDVRRAEIELERERNTYVYEIEFKSGGYEYEYKVDAVTGEILERECEKDD